MSAARELSSIAAELDQIKGRFRHTGSTLSVDDSDESLFEELILDAMGLIVEALGAGHEHWQRLRQIEFDAKNSFYGGPSLASVGSASNVVRAAAKIVERTQGRSDAASIPAANRYVTLADNQRSQLDLDLAELKDKVRISNETNEDDRQNALSEIAAFEATIVQPRVATDLIQRFVDKVLGWITKVFSGALVGEVAKRLVDALLRLI